MRGQRLRWGFVLWLACAMLAAPSLLRAQTITVQQTTSLSFKVFGSELTPGGNLEVTVICTPGLKPCPNGITIYASVEQCTIPSPTNATLSIPASQLVAQINRGSMTQFNQVVPPFRQGCGLTLYSGPLPQTTEMVSVTAALFVDARKHYVPIASYQGNLNIHVDTF